MIVGLIYREFEESGSVSIESSNTRLRYANRRTENENRNYKEPRVKGLGTIDIAMKGSCNDYRLDLRTSC
jgi:hypothetical protein